MTPRRARAVLAFRRRLAAYLRHEARCSACAAERRRNPDSPSIPICPVHSALRSEVAFGGRRG